MHWFFDAFSEKFCGGKKNPGVSWASCYFVLQTSPKVLSLNFDFLLRYDERLSFHTKDNEDITLSHEFLHKIWVPDTYFPESLSANKHQVMVPNVLLRLSYTGKVLYSSRVTVVTKCVMDLVMFPLDTQVRSEKLHRSKHFYMKNIIHS